MANADIPDQQAAGGSGLLQELLRRARVSLVDTGSRNRLISFPKGNSKSKTIEIIDELSDEIFDILLWQERKMSFLPGRARDAGPDQNGPDEGLYLPPPADEVGGKAERHQDTKLQTKFTPEGLQKRLLSLYRDAKSMVEEQGVDVLYLALGFLEWYEAPSSEIAKYSPLVLLPVELVRDDARSAFKLHIREEDLSSNIALEERLRQDFGIILPAIPESEDWKPSQYFEQVLETVQSQNRWRIDENMMALGFFSFTKLIMYHDLDPENWPNGKLADHPLIQALLVDGFPEEEKLFPDDVSMDEVLHPADMVHVVDADSSQALVVEAIRRGRNLVVQGPPGTGKSQTITNVIATAVREGKSVLFVAEKLAALNVVHSRLQRAGLSSICLELHSRNANKRAVLEEIARTLNSPPPSLTDSSIAEAVCRARDQLNRYAAMFNTSINKTQVTPFDALGTQVFLSGAGIQPPDLEMPAAATWSPEETEKVKMASRQYANIIRSSGLPSDHPWNGIRAQTLQPADLQRLVRKLNALAAKCNELRTATAELAKYLGWENEPSVADIRKICSGIRLLADRPTDNSGAIDAMLQCPNQKLLADCIEAGLTYDREARALSEWFTDIAWRTDPSPLRMVLAAKGHSFLGKLSGEYRSARDTFLSISKPPVPDDVDERIRRLDRLIAAFDVYVQIETELPFLKTNLGTFWQSENTDYSLAAKVLSWLQLWKETASWIPAHVLSDTGVSNADYMQALSQLGSTLGDAEKQLQECLELMDVDLEVCFAVSAIEALIPSRVAEKCLAWENGVQRYDEWVRLTQASGSLRALGAENAAVALETGAIPVDRIEADIAYCRAESIWKQAIAVQPDLARVEGDARQALVDEFRQLEDRRQKFAQREVLAKHGAAMPPGSLGEMGVVRGEIARKRGHLPVRKLMNRTGSVMQRIKPVMLMSPLSVAQFLPPGSMEFDLLVIDEASQVKPEDALGAIARCRQIAVIGDKKQLPPSSFFDRMVSDESADDDEVASAGLISAGELESVLTLCEARGVPRRMLRWHYRSRHPSLIEVSNSEFYEDGLFLPPAPNYDRGQDGFLVRRVAGAYDRGGKRTNRIEADEVIRAIKRHAQNNPERSLGIVTFSIAQKQLMEDLLELECRTDRVLEKFASQISPEQLFVKNLENVQGDERDVVFVSVGYGPRQPGSGLDSMAFGPVSAEGGERRLNVLFTRARYKCKVFVSFGSGDIDLGRTSQRGPEVLKRFLKFGETGSTDLPFAHGGYDSPFEEAVASAIRAMGYEVDSQVGSTGFKIDLAVKHPDRPGTYLCAIECDGANYHSSRSARERDRLRQSILEGLGWQFYRIWSTDWFRKPDREKDKLRTKLKAIVSEATPSSSVPVLPPDTAEHLNREETGETHGNELSYVEADFAVGNISEPHEVVPREMAEIVVKIITVEGPVHEEEIARRVARLFGKDRTGVRILQAVTKGLRLAKSSGRLSCEGKFWSVAGSEMPKVVRSRANVSLTLRRADMLPPSEIREAARIAVLQNGSMEREELITAASRLFGFDRTGPDLRNAIDLAIT